MVEGVHRSCAEVVDRTDDLELTIFDFRRQDGLKLREAFNSKLYILTNPRYPAGRRVFRESG
jgi:hypothetical protein